MGQNLRIHGIYDGFGNWFIHLPLRVLVGIPASIMLCLFGNLKLWSATCPPLYEQPLVWLLTLPLRLIAAPFVIVTLGLFARVRL